MIVFYVFSAVLMLAVAVLVGRTIFFTKKRRKLSERKSYRTEKNEEYARQLAEMLRCRTVSVKNRYDDAEFAKLREVLQTLFPLIHEKAEKHIFGEDCYGYKIAGKHADKNILLMSHHDVVAAPGEWKYPPFDGVIAEGKLWGRGAVDTKTSLFAEFAAVEELLQNGETPDRNIWIVSSHNEELLGDGINKAVDWFRKERIEFEFAVDEGGGVVDLQFGKKTFCFAMIAVHEKGRHGAICRTDRAPTDKKMKSANAIDRMTAFMREINGSRRLFARKISPELQALLETAGLYLPFPLRVMTANIRLFAPLLIRFAPKINKQAEQMLGTTCRWTAIRGGRYNRADEKICEAQVSFRQMNGEDFAEEFDKFCKIAEKYGISVESMPSVCEYRDPADTDCAEYDRLRRITAEVFPDAGICPYINPAFTDARAVMDICKKTYRFVPVRMSEQQLDSMHNPNENVSVEAIGNAVEFYARLIRAR